MAQDAEQVQVAQHAAVGMAMEAIGMATQDPTVGHISARSRELVCPGLESRTSRSISVPPAPASMTAASSAVSAASEAAGTISHSPARIAANAPPQLPTIRCRAYASTYCTPARWRQRAAIGMAAEAGAPLGSNTHRVYIRRPDELRRTARHQL